ncbi:MAG: hypothetical protein IKB70_03330 [Bacilli bacterium]|nr:hypothetical protein [Bacilli bacterium]
MLTTITDLLTALLQLLKEKHLLSKDYQEHLLFERLQEGIDEDIDRIKEIALACGYNEIVANAKSSLVSASKILEDDNDVLSIEKRIISEIEITTAKLNNNKGDGIEGTFNQYKAQEGIINVLGDISEKRLRDIYLLRFSK